MFLLTAENIDYVSEIPAPNEPAEDATDEEKQEYNDELKQWTKDNKTARVYILGSMTDSLAAEYESDGTACGIMLRLEQDFGEVSLVKVLSLVNKFLTSKMGDKTVNEHFNKLCVLAEELKTAGYPFQEEVQVMVVLNSLPPSWEQFKISFCHSERTLNMRNLRQHLLMEEDRRLNSGKDKASYQPELHLGEYKNNGNRRNWNKRGGGPDLRDKINYKRDRDQRNYRDERRDREQHGNNNNNNNSFQKIDKRNYKCHNCGNTGHFRSECTKRRKPNSERDNFHKDDSRKGNQSPEGGAIS
uniref:CCHC-type domain-containing protein n=1 Tax=Triticum urartu TaxID=4572 RepID=A0A8R7JZ37_TRIUA